MVSPKRIASFCEVSVAIRCGVSGMNGFGTRTFKTVSINSFGSRIPGLTNYRKSLFVADDFYQLLQLRIFHLFRNLYIIQAGSQIQPVQCAADLSRCRLSSSLLCLQSHGLVNISPPFSSSGRPFGNASSITRYSHSSAFTNGATYVCLGSNYRIQLFHTVFLSGSLLQKRPDAV